MKTCLLIFLFAACYVQCRKLAVPLDKNANLAFINMEGGGAPKPGTKPSQQPALVPNSKPINLPAPAKTPVSPTTGPAKPIVTPTATAKPTVAPAQPAKPVVMPAQIQAQIQPAPVNPKPVANPITTPGPGSVKQLVNFYDSQGKASLIRPYSYAQAVKQG